LKIDKKCPSPFSSRITWVCGMYSPYLHKLGGFNSSTPLFILKSYGLFLFFLGYEIFIDDVSFFFSFWRRELWENCWRRANPNSNKDWSAVWVSSHHKIVWAVNERTISIKKSKWSVFFSLLSFEFVAFSII
jgi:hypothetical protein